MLTDQPVSPRHEVAIVACARWEDHCITEWLLYHRSIGVDHVYLYCNDDDPIHLYGQILPFMLAAPSFVTFVHYPFQGQQFYMYRHFLEHRKDEAAWIAFLDVDEFLCLPGVDNVKTYVAACPPEWDSIHFNWNYFGNSGHAERPIGSVLINYTRRERELSITTKNLTRTACIDIARINRKHAIWHDWGDMLRPGSVAVNVLGEPMAPYLGDVDEATKAAFADPGKQDRIRAIALIHHYAFKSQRDLKMRVARGTLGEFQNQALWAAHELDGGSDFLARLNEVEDTYLAAYWRRHLAAAAATTIVPRAGRPNVALGKPALQSSISQWSREQSTAADAAGAVSGRITGSFQFHTELEESPWWRVDLLDAYAISEIRIYNRVDDPGLRIRLGHFVIDGSSDGETWRTLYAHDGRLVGGADGYPFILRSADPGREIAVCRHLRVTTPQRACLHLDQVEVYGEKWRGAAAAPAQAQQRRGIAAALDDLIGLLGKRIEAPPPSAAASPGPAARETMQDTARSTMEPPGKSEAGADRGRPDPLPGVPRGMLTRSAVVQTALDLFEAPRYLEIGVDSGETFHALSAAQKVAVDPGFKFAPPASTAAIQYFPVTSDDYFARHCPPDQQFDVVFVDGLHTFEQTLRDLQNAVLRLSPRGVVIIDDILPVSYHASLPDLAEAFMVRDHLSPGSVDNTWMGDVYKLAFFVQTFMQQLSYATVQETHGQLILWRSPRPADALVPRTMLDIALLSFLDTIKHRSVYRIRPMDAIVAEMRAFVGRRAAPRPVAPPPPSPPAPPPAPPRAPPAAPPAVAAPAPPAVTASAPPPAPAVAQPEPGRSGPIYVSCGAELLYAEGGLYEGPACLAELRQRAPLAEFITDVGEVFPAHACRRKIEADHLIGPANFIRKLEDHYAWVNAVFACGAASRLVRLNDVYLHRNTLHHIAGNRVVTIYETARPIDRAHSMQPAWTPDQLRTLAVGRPTGSPALYLGSAGSANYGHWLIDDLTRAEALELAGRHAGSPLVDVILPEVSVVLNTVRDQSLRVTRSGQCGGETHFVSANRVLHFKELYYVTPVSYHPAVKSPQACRRLRDRIRAALPKPAGPENIYLLRGLSHGRAIENQADVTRVFESHGFKVVDVQGMSFADQVAAVGGARVIAGCMGAAMTNAVFCDPGTAVLQLAPEGWVEPFYWDLADVCGHGYTRGP